MIRTAILGASGYVGGELLRLIAAHPQLVPARLFGGSKTGRPLSAVHPHLAPAYPHALLETIEPGAFKDVDLVFAALPHGHSQRLMLPSCSFVRLTVTRTACATASASAARN